MMKALLLKNFGGTENLYFGEVPLPTLKSTEVLVKVAATALNRADILQRRGHYPPPAGESPILGLEMSGEVVALGSAVTQVEIGQRVCGLLAGGGYAEYAAIDYRLLLPIPKGISLQHAAALPEVFLTAFQGLVELANLQANESVLIHAGAGGVGTAAIQIAKAIGVSPIATTASPSKHDRLIALGATHCFDYRSSNLEIEILEQVGNISVILDFLGAAMLPMHLRLLDMDGRLVVLAAMQGTQAASFDLRTVLSKRLKIQGSTLRNRSLDYKIRLTGAFAQFALPLFENGVLCPVIDAVWDWKDTAVAHEAMEANRHFGKIILAIQ